MSPPAATLEELRALEREHLVPAYARLPVQFVRGAGTRLWDAAGREYLDLLAGIATTSLGHAHPVLAAVAAEQLATLGHVSNLAATPVQVRLAERLLELVHAPAGSGVFFCGSGDLVIARATEGKRGTTRVRRKWEAQPCLYS